MPYSLACLIFCAVIIIQCPRFFIAKNIETDKLSLLEFKAKISDDPFRVMSSWNNDTVHVDVCKWHGVTCAARNKHQRVVSLDLQSSNLTGELTNSSFSGSVALESLHIGGNFFQGVMQSLTRLRQLNISHNNLSSEIPLFLASLNLQLLDLSYNSLEGSVPTGGVFNNATRISIARNNKLCGGIPELKLPKCYIDKSLKRRLLGHHRIRKHRVAIIFGIIIVVLMVASCVFLSLYIFWCRKSVQVNTTFDDFELFPNLSYQKLRKATNRFSPENLIGKGAFGVVYKGNLDDHQTPTIAIKIFNLEHHCALNSFMNECHVLRNIRHRNLVRVISACSGVDYQGNDFKALIYKYMVNGSLEDWLHPKIKMKGMSLNFQQRLDIAIDVACAIEYLHHQCGTSVVHCDIKPSNILLDEKMVAHVSDFGLAKLCLSYKCSNKSRLSSSNTDDESASVGVRGTIGYTPPEYGLGNEESTHGDVYSFGILIIEMFTRRRPTEAMFNGGKTLHHFVKAALPKRVTEILDRSDHALLKDIVGGQHTHRNTNIVMDGLISVLEIAIDCSVELPQQRLNMTDVTAKLYSVRNKFLATHLQQRRRIQTGPISFV